MQAAKSLLIIASSCGSRKINLASSFIMLKAGTFFPIFECKSFLLLYMGHAIRKCCSFSMLFGHTGHVLKFLSILGLILRPFSIMRLWSDVLSLVMATLCLRFFISVRYVSNFTLVLKDLNVSALVDVFSSSIHLV